jgi:hypothetical protein
VLTLLTGGDDRNTASCSMVFLTQARTAAFPASTDVWLSLIRRLKVIALHHSENSFQRRCTTSRTEASYSFYMAFNSSSLAEMPADGM